MRDISYAVASIHVAGVHHWPDAPVSRAYLRSPHRHVFWIKAAVEVTHADREVEIHDLRDVLEAELKTFPMAVSFGQGFLRDFETMSCEQLALTLSSALRIIWPNRAGMVEVLEDNEAGGRVVWHP